MSDAYFVEGVVITRLKKLRGGKMALRNYRHIKTARLGTRLVLDTDGGFTHRFLSSAIDVTITGSIIDYTLTIKSSIINELKKPYLRKGFKDIEGISFGANRSHIGVK